MQIRNTKALRKYNQFTILNEIIENQPISRAELSKKLKVSHATISYTVKDLIEQGLIEETEFSESTGGRPPVLLAFKGDNKYIISFAVEERNLRYGIFNLNQKLLLQGSLEVAGDFQGFLDAIYTKLKEELEKLQIHQEQVIGLGLSIPGIYKQDGDQIIDSTTKFWEDREIKKEIVARFKLPVYIENDANLAAYYEWAYGVGRGYANLIYFYLGEGIGGGIILGNKLYRGSHGNAGEIGHIKVKANGYKCDCGGIGCLETVASLKAISKEIAKGIQNGEETLLKDLANTPYGVEDIVAAYQRNDYFCRKVVDEAFKYINNGVSSLINIFDPELLIIGGENQELNKILTKRLKEDLGKISYANLVDELTIKEGSAVGCLQLRAVAVYVFDKWKQKI